MNYLVREKKNTELTGVSLFSGAGGMDVGFSRAGFKILWANDFNEDACNTFRENHGDIIECGSILDYMDDISKFKGVDIVFGGPPCQGFSVAGKMDPTDSRSQLVFSFMDVVEEISPRAFVMENVKALGALEKWSEVRKKLLLRAKDLGYDLAQIVILNASHFGVPQKRERMFFIGIKDPKSFNEVLGIEPLFEKYKKIPVKVGEIVKKLGRVGELTNPKTCNAIITLAKNPVLRRSPYAGMLFNGAGRPIDPNGYANTLPASMGGNRTPFVDESHIFDNEESWIEKYHEQLLAGSEPHKSQKVPARLRRITIKEAMKIQSFPDEYIFTGGNNAIYKQIGNAVPCDLAHVVANVVKRLL